MVVCVPLKKEETKFWKDEMKNEERMIRMSIDIPESEHKYLKMCCAKIGLSIKEFVSKAAIEKVDAWEDKWMLERWEKDGTRQEIEAEMNDETRSVFTLETIGDETVFVEHSYKDLIEERKRELNVV